MKLLIIAYYYPPINSGGTQRPLKMGKYLPRFGHDVTILTHTYNADETHSGNPRIIRIHDISFNKERSTPRKRLQWLALRLHTELLNKLGRYHSIYKWWKRRVIKQSAAIIADVKPDVLIASYPPVETLEIGLHLSQLYKIPLITDFRDGLIFEPIESKRMAQYPCIRNTYQQIEAVAVNHASAVTTVAQPITQYYRTTYNHPAAHVISNAFDPEDLLHLPPENHFNPEHFNIVFTGRFGLSDKSTRVDYFFDALRLLVKINPVYKNTVKMHLVGEYSPAELYELQDLVQGGIVCLHGLVERNQALAFQRDADLLLIISHLDRVSFVSSKIFEYLFAGKPILALTHNTVLEEIVKETCTGWIVHPHQTEAIKKQLEDIIQGAQAPRTDLQAIEKYSFQSQMEKFDCLLRTV